MDELHDVGRRFRDALEPVAANVYFAPEAIAAYGELGLDYPEGYFASRGACLGHPSGEVIAAAFGVFYPPLVKMLVDQAWSKTTPAAVLAARETGAVAAMERLLGDVATADEIATATDLLRRMADAGAVAGRALFAGLRAQGWPGTPWGDLWRAADLVREYRGDSHLASWVAHGLSAPEVMLLSEPWWGLQLNTAMRTRAWPDEEVAAAIEALRKRGLLAAESEGDALTAEGEALRESVEEMTDRSMAPLFEVIGPSGAADLLALIEPWAAAIVERGGAPAPPATPRR
jgi:hypothetical protein